MASENGKVIDKDTGLNAFLSKLKSLPQVSNLTVGIVEDSPKKQFRYGTLQKFRQQTADLLLRTTVDNRENEIKTQLMDIAKKVLLDGADMTAELRDLGAEIQQAMRDQTDPPPQLATSIIVQVDA